MMSMYRGGTRAARLAGWETQWSLVPGPAGSIELRVMEDLFLVFDAAVRGRLLGWSGSTAATGRARALFDDPAQVGTLVAMWDLAHLLSVAQHSGDIECLRRAVITIGERMPVVRGLALSVAAALHLSLPSCMPEPAPLLRGAYLAGRVAVMFQRAGELDAAAVMWQVCALRWCELAESDEMADFYVAAALARARACQVDHDGDNADGIDDVGTASAPEALAVRKLTSVFVMSSTVTRPREPGAHVA